MATTANWTTQIDQTTADFKNTFGQLTTEQLNWKPNEQTWSIGQNIDHLIVTNETYYPVIKSVKAGTYKLPLMGSIGFMVNAFGKMVLSAVQPDRKRKTKTFPIWQPTQSKIATDILSKFETHQTELKQMISGSADLLDKGTIISSPANKNIVYKLDMAYNIITAHEQRHFEQAKEVLAILPK
ncbi:MAG TPA: DinB family protein [Bacteroidia bacterium]|jgi:hypothetical protein|nr:DinB family protein [Bacteroidia bacterium]